MSSLEPPKRRKQSLSETGKTLTGIVHEVDESALDSVGMRGWNKLRAAARRGVFVKKLTTVLAIMTASDDSKITGTLIRALLYVPFFISEFPYLVGVRLPPQLFDCIILTPYPNSYRPFPGFDCIILTPYPNSYRPFPGSRVSLHQLL